MTMNRCLTFLLPSLLVLLGIPNTLDLTAQETSPGLVAQYTHPNRQSAPVTRVVATPNFSLQSGESIHPQVDSQFAAFWSGMLQVDRAGKYKIHVDAKFELNGESNPGWVQLPTGKHPITLTYARKPGDAQLQLRWESEFFAEEPIPSELLSHAAIASERRLQELQDQDTIEHGRYLFAELGCANCHAASDWKLQSRRGPDLSQAASRLDADWVYEWLKDPHQYRKGAVMPVCLDSEQDRADVTAFIMSLGKPADAVPKGSEQVQRGKELFGQVGCLKCHDEKNNLNSIGSKYVSADHLAEFILAPHHVDPGGRMPQLFDPSTERHLARAIASHLMTQQRATPYRAAPEGDKVRGAKLFTGNGCASCHTVPSALIQEEALQGPAFGQVNGLALRHFWDFESDNNKRLVERVSNRSEKVNGREELIPGGAGRGDVFNFDGKTFIELAHFHRPDTMTISCWVRTTKGGSIITWGRPGGGQRGSRELRMNIGQDGENSLCYGEYNSDGGWRPVVVRPTEVNLVDGQWHHIAVVRRGESIQHYVDGKEEGKPGRAQPGGGDYTDRLLIGALGLQQNPSNYFRGQLDDLAVWNMALSAEQIAELAAGANSLSMAQPPEREIKRFDVQSGCLAESVAAPLPNYRLGEQDRTALRKFLTTVHPDNQVAYQPAPLTTHDLRIQQFRCTACHQLHDQNVQAAVQETDDGQIVRVERPPLLTGAGEKLTAQWLRAVLVEKKRNRPWLKLRMPHFGEGVGDLPDLLAGACGVSPTKTAPLPDRKLAAAGLEMIGERRGEVSCIACHDYRGINRRKDGVVPAPDLALAGKTVRRDWFDRWMHDPSRMQPGTSMPQLFLDVSAEERELRIQQLWSALVYQDQLPLPKGVLEKRTEGTRIVVNDEPVLFRMATTTPVGRIDRAINVGIPGGFNFTFDAVSCRLVYAWKGAFIDAGPAWNGRGGNPVSAGTSQLLALPTEHQIRVGGAPQTIRFLGYRMQDQMPVFRYYVNGATVEQQINISDSGVFQRYVVQQPAQDVAYVGGAEIPFTSETGVREGNIIRYPKAERVEFTIEFPFESKEAK